MSEHHEGLSRAAHAHEVPLQDSDDAPQRENARATDLNNTDIETQDLGAVRQALKQGRATDYSIRVVRIQDIPRDQLKVEP